MKLSPVRLGLGAVGLAIGVVGVLALREATLSVHEEVDPGTATELVVSAKVRGGEEGQSKAEMVEAVVLACRLEVSSDVVGGIERLDDDRFRATLEPSLDESNRRQLRGCLEDWIVDHIRLDVVSLG